MQAQPPPDLISSVFSQNKSLFLLVGVLAAGKFLWPLIKPRVKGFVGEAIVNFGALRGLDASHYQVFNDIYVPRPDEAGTTQIDHVVVSPFGIFVIETKNYSGWIFGSENDRNWTQQFRNGHKTTFQNPLHQNKLHISALAKELGLALAVFHNVIYFSGESTFKTPLPGNVMSSGLRTYIESFDECLLSDEEVFMARGRLQGLVERTDRKTAKSEHIAAIRSRAA